MPIPLYERSCCITARSSKWRLDHSADFLQQLGKHVVEDFWKLLKENQKATDQKLDAFRATTAREVLELVGDIASQSDKIPTLFKPPRAADEVVFSTHVDFFKNLLGSDNARKQAVDVFEGWLGSSKIQCRFLASDFAGMFQLVELAPRLRELANEDRKKWKTLSPVEMGCTLNYWWAASRCEPSMYDTLKSLLIDWKDPFVRKWILFVPCQMPDARLAHIVELFLRTRGSESPRDVIEAAIAAIEALNHAGYDMSRVVERYRAVFERASLWEEAWAAVADVPIIRPKKGLIARAKKMFQRR